MATTEEDFDARLERAREPVEDAIGAQAATLILPTARSQTPHLKLTPPVRPSDKSAPLVRVSVFTSTTKMRAPSFSLPAGPPAQGGTCPASAARGHDTPEGRWICYGCYATTGNYALPSVQAVQLVRKRWVQNALKDGTLAEQLIAALRVYHQHPRHGESIDAKGNRVRLAMNVRYFRIHDSGDFSWAGPEYALAWFEVARAFPEVIFWAPSRDWIFPKMRAVFAKAPSNVILRPSALTIDTAPPLVAEMRAGSTVMQGRAPTDALYDCPAYRHAEHSCESAGCRTCWTHPGTEINYAPHGAITKIRPNPRTDPRATLAGMLSLYEREEGAAVPTRRNHGADGDGEAPAVFEAFMAAKGMHPADYPEVQWRELLDHHGLRDPDNQTEYIEGAAEW